MIVVKLLSYRQEGGSVYLKLPPDWDGPSGSVIQIGPMVEIKIDPNNTRTLLAIVLTAIRQSGDPEAVEIARMTCRSMLGGGL